MEVQRRMSTSRHNAFGTTRSRTTSQSYIHVQIDMDIYVYYTAECPVSLALNVLLWNFCPEAGA
jgi:hypothetical protein